MIDLTAKPKDLISPFFVQKKSGKLRLVLDCRGTNRRFQSPPPMALSAGATWGSVRVPRGQSLYIAQSDIRDYFYGLELPAPLQDLFCLPAILGHLLKEWQISGDGIDHEGWTFPRLRAPYGLELGHVDQPESSSVYCSGGYRVDCGLLAGRGEAAPQSRVREARHDCVR